MDMGFLSSDDFVARRSKTLINNQTAQLDELPELTRFIQTWSNSYRQEISELAFGNSNKLRDEVRLIITIVARQEGGHIRDTLAVYLNQAIDFESFEIIVLDNHDTSVKKDATEAQVAAFQKEHPEINLLYAYKQWGKDEIASVGNATKVASDIALLRIQARNQESITTVLVSNDADTVSIEPNYLRAILDEFDHNHETEALLTQISVPVATFRKPNIYAALSLWDEIDLNVINGEPENLRGASSAYRAAMYAAVGGYNPKCTQAEDLELGFLIADARQWRPSSVIQLKTTKMTVDPRRILESVANRIPVNEMFYRFESSPEIRSLNNDELLKRIPDDLDFELLEEDVDSFWGCGDTGMYKWRGSRYVDDFHSAATRLGIGYAVKDQRVFLENIEKLLDNYEADFGVRPKIIHSTRRPYSAEHLRAIKRFFFTFSDSAISCRKKIAKSLAEQIRRAQERGDTQIVQKLTGEYERFRIELSNEEKP